MLDGQPIGPYKIRSLPWTSEEEAILEVECEKGLDWKTISVSLPNRTACACRTHYPYLNFQSRGWGDDKKFVSNLSSNGWKLSPMPISVQAPKVTDRISKDLGRKAISIRQHGTCLLPKIRPQDQVIDLPSTPTYRQMPTYARYIPSATKSQTETSVQPYFIPTPHDSSPIRNDISFDVVLDTLSTTPHHSNELPHWRKSSPVSCAPTQHPRP